ncbi:MAG: hypothetical protein IPM69_03865 [Ignavibacteria bacterium]|nr:hypothetical protein [Ignavibacteria bacterium]
MKKSPTSAVLYSLAFPGLGQYYVESYWKVPIFAAGAGACLYGIIWNHNQYTAKRDEVNAAIADTNFSKSALAVLKSQREFYHNSRDLSGLYLIAVYVISTVDAYTGAHLYDFDVSDKLVIRILPDFRQTGAYGPSEVVISSSREYRVLAMPSVFGKALPS